MSDERQYLYAIGPADEAPELAEAGLDGAPVRVVTRGRLAAYVSSIEGKKVRPVRKHLAAHHSVLRTLAARTTALPMSFGMIAESEDEVSQLLEAKHDELSERVTRLHGRVEMTVRLKWDVENVFSMFVELDPDLRVARDRLVASGNDREEQIAVGELFSAILEGAREGDWETLHAALEQVCEEIKRNDPRDESEVVSLATLVRREEIGAFEDAVHAAAEAFDDRYLIDLGGPHPPHSFVSVHLSLDAA